MDKKMLVESLEFMRGQVKDTYKRLANGEIDRAEFLMLRETYFKGIDMIKEQLGEDYKEDEVVPTKRTKSAIEKGIESEEGLVEAIEDVEDDIKRLCRERAQKLERGELYVESGAIAKLVSELRELKDKLAKLQGRDNREDMIVIEYGEDLTKREDKVEAPMVEEIVVEAPQVEERVFTNKTSIRVPKKYHKYIDELYKDIEGYRIELHEGYIFESSECGVECRDTQKEILDIIKYEIVEG